VLLGGIVAVVASLSGCFAVGQRRVPVDRFNYSEAIGRSSNEQMLLNLVRLRYRDVPVFLAVSSVLTQYVWSTNLGVNGASGRSLGDPLWSIGGSGGAVYIERPTVTYSPLTGDEFAAQLLTPISGNLIFSLLESGWPAAQLLSMTLRRMNHVQNMPWDADEPRSVEGVQAFQEVVGLIIALGRRDAIEMEREGAGPDQKRFLVFTESDDPETQRLVAELKARLRLDPARSRFKVTTRLTRRAPDEITMRERSLLMMMGFLSRGVELPPAHLAEGRGRVIEPVGDPATRELTTPLRVHASKQWPRGASVRVKYHGHWFYILHADEHSKQAFGLLTYLFQLKAPKAPGGVPMVTVPTG